MEDRPNKAYSSSQFTSYLTALGGYTGGFGEKYELEDHIVEWLRFRHEKEVILCTDNEMCPLLRVEKESDDTFKLVPVEI